MPAFRPALHLIGAIVSRHNGAASFGDSLSLRRSSSARQVARHDFALGKHRLAGETAVADRALDWLMTCSSLARRRLRRAMADYYAAQDASRVVLGRVPSVCSGRRVHDTRFADRRYSSPQAHGGGAGDRRRGDVPRLFPHYASMSLYAARRQPDSPLPRQFPDAGIPSPGRSASHESTIEGARTRA